MWCQTVSLERFEPSPDQLQRLSDEAYTALISVTMAVLMDIDTRYQYPDINTLEPDEAIDWLESQALLMDGQLEAANDALTSGGTLADWEQALTESVVAGALLALLFFFNGVEGLRTEAISRNTIRQINAILRGHSVATRRLAARIANGDLTDKQIRAANYRRESALRESFDRARMIDAVARGHNEGIRNLGNPHPCPDCPRHIRSDWVGIEEIVPIATQCVCQDRCKCWIRTRLNPERFAADVRTGRVQGRISRYE